LIVINDKEIALHSIIEQNKVAILGTSVAHEFGSLPYLLKVLDVRQMLSIQVHPDKESAKKSFEKENEQGIPLTAPNRNYKDANHKPELMVALSDFWLLHGFKPANELEEILEAVPEFNFLLSYFENEGYEGLYQKVMTMTQEEVNSLLEPVITKIAPLYENGELQKSEESFWAARAAETFCRKGQYDKGIFSIYFFNLLHLKKGEGIYQDVGLPHAYLEGQNMEIMANSDNVLRAGLTDKHIDVPELMKHTVFTATVPNIIVPPAHASFINYENPSVEFQLSSFAYKEGEQALFEATSAEIILVLEGSVRLNASNSEIVLQKGEAAFVVAATSYIATATTETHFFKAGVPLN
jgi:mannose-6-phosphate isomerase